MKPLEALTLDDLQDRRADFHVENLVENPDGVASPCALQLACLCLNSHGSYLRSCSLV